MLLSKSTLIVSFLFLALLITTVFSADIGISEPRFMEPACPWVQDIFSNDRQFIKAEPLHEPAPHRDDREVLYEYGFEDGWNGWTFDGHWELSDEDVHSGEFSAHCPVGELLRDHLTSPVLQIPESGHTYFDFWVHCDAPDWDPDDDGFLDDYFRLQLSVEGGAWQDVLYDYTRNFEWEENWIHYVPGTWWRDDLPEWRMRMDLSQFAGEHLRLWWEFVTDDVMDGFQGTGLWIDDFRLICAQGYENDVGVEWIMVGYPCTITTEIPIKAKTSNFGFRDQDLVRRLLQVDGDRLYPIVPWGAIESESHVISSFLIRSNTLENRGFALTRAFTVLPEDEYPDNDTAYTEAVFYPGNIWMLGYDGRIAVDAVEFDVGEGPAVRFTPAADRVDGRFNLEAVEVTWANDFRVGRAVTRLTVYSDEGGVPHDELISADITVSPADLFPGVHYIDLSGYDELRNLDADFWVAFTIDRQDNLPRVMGRNISDADRYLGEGHFFSIAGVRVDEIETDLLIHAILTNDRLEQCNLEVKQEMDFGLTRPGMPVSRSMIVFGAGADPVTIRGVEVDSDAFRVEASDGREYAELRAGETKEYAVQFVPANYNEYEATLEFDCDDNSPPVVALTGNCRRIPEIDLFPDVLDFGYVMVGEVEEQLFTISNIGQSSLFIRDISCSSRSFQFGEIDEIVVEPDQDHEMFVSFRGEDAGDHSATMYIYSNDPLNRVMAVELSATAVSVPRPIHDIELIEDFDRFAVADLDTVFPPPVGNDYVFNIACDNDNLTAESDDDHRLWLVSRANWTGSAEISISASDDEELRDNHRRHPRRIERTDLSPDRDETWDHSFDVLVTPVNDLPTLFNLLTPEDNYRMSEGENLRFAWQRSIDQVEDSLMAYYLALVFPGDTMFFGTIDLELEMSREAMLYRSDEPLDIEWMVYACDGIDSIPSSQVFRLHVPPLDVKGDDRAVIYSYSLEAPYPNPFNSSIEVSFSVPVKGEVALYIFDLAGREAAVLVSGTIEAGRHRIAWDASGFPAGMYFVRMNADGYREVRKMILTK